jgi:hypothetical protein
MNGIGLCVPKVVNCGATERNLLSQVPMHYVGREIAFTETGSKTKVNMRVFLDQSIYDEVGVEDVLERDVFNYCSYRRPN